MTAPFTGLLLSSPCLSVLSLLTSLSTYEKGSARRKETESEAQPRERSTERKAEPGEESDTASRHLIHYAHCVTLFPPVTRLRLIPFTSGV